MAEKPSHRPPNPKSIAEYPSSKEDYALQECIGAGATAEVWSAKCQALEEAVAVKIIDLEKAGEGLDEIRSEILFMVQSNHPNVVRYYTSFVVGSKLWLVMKLLRGGSALELMRLYSPHGLEEDLIAAILHEVLRGLDYLHSNGQIHRDVKAGNILVDLDGTVQLADFGVSSALVEGGSRREKRETFVGTPCWMAPEVMEQVHGYDHKADIWSFGITALELATGSAPYAKFPPMKVLMMTLKNPSPTLDLDHGGPNKYSKTFKKMIDLCLQKDPEKRPSAAKLLEHEFFKKVRGRDYVKANLVDKVPPLSARRKNAALSPPAASQAKQLSSGRWRKNKCGEWDFEPLTVEEEEEVKKDTADAEDISVSKEPSTDAAKRGEAPVDGTVEMIKLRVRDRSGTLKDIRFTFTHGVDTAVGIARELVDAGLLEPRDEEIFSLNISRLLHPQFDKTAIRFPLSDAETRRSADPDSLKGFAQLILQRQDSQSDSAAAAVAPQ